MTTTPVPVTARPSSRAAQLAAQATEAAEIRDALTHPDVVALRVETLRGRVDRFIWTGMILGLAFTMTNVQQFTAHTIGAGPGSLGWWAAWLLDPTVSVILLGVLLAERETSRWQIPAGSWARAAKWSLLSATYVMNTWESWAAGNLAGIVLHSVPPLAVFMGAEAVTDCQDKLTEAVHRAHQHASLRADRKAQAAPDQRAAETRTTTPAPVQPAPATPPFRAVPDRPDPTSADRPAARPGLHPVDRSAGSKQTAAPVRPADRSATQRAGRTGAGSSRRRSGRSPAGTGRTDAQLARVLRELAEQAGGPPSQYAIKKRLGVGSARAARLLADLDTPSGSAFDNDDDLTLIGAAAGAGAAARKDSTR